MSSKKPSYPVLITGVERNFMPLLLLTLVKEHSLLLLSEDQKILETLDDLLKNKGKKVFLSCLPLDNHRAMIQLSKRIFEQWSGLKAFISGTHFHTALQPLREVDTTTWKKYLESQILIPWRLISTMERLLGLCHEHPQAIFLQTPLMPEQNLMYRGVYRACCGALEDLVVSWHAEVQAFVTVNLMLLSPSFGPLPGRRKETIPSKNIQRLSQMLLSCLNHGHHHKEGKRIHIKEKRSITTSLTDREQYSNSEEPQKN